MPRKTFRLALALLFATAILGAHTADARNAGPRLSKRAYYKKARLHRARGNRQYRLYKRGGAHAQMHLQRSQRNHTKAKVFRLKARAKKALRQGNKAKADKLWRKAQALEATIKALPPKAKKTTAGQRSTKKGAQSSAIKPPSAKALAAKVRKKAKAYHRQAKRFKTRAAKEYRLARRRGARGKIHRERADRYLLLSKLASLKGGVREALNQGDTARAAQLWLEANEIQKVLQPNLAMANSKHLVDKHRTKTEDRGKVVLSREQKERRHAKVKKLEAKAHKALQQGDKAKARRLWREAQTLDATIKPLIPEAKTASNGGQHATPKDRPGASKIGGTQVPDAEQPAAATAQPKAPVAGASYGKMKRYLANKNLSSALRVLDAMEREAAHAKGIKGVWKRFQAKRGRRALRRAAVRVGREAIRSGGAAGDQELLEQRREYAKQVRALRAAGMTPEQRQALRAELAQVPNLRTHGSNYARARAVLRHLNTKGRKYENKPVRRVIARLGDMVFGSVRSANAKLDRALITEARYLMAKGPDGATQARLLLLNAKGRGLSKTWRYRRTHRAARRALSKAIKQAVKDGNPAGVELAYQLRESYEMDRKGPDYRLGDREIRKMNRQIERAEISMVKMLAKQAAWIAKYPKQAQNFFGYGPDAAAIANNLARETANRLMENGTSVPGSIVRQLNKTDAKLTQRKPGLLRRIASLPLKVALLPFKVLKWATVTQARHVIWGNSGGAPPPPMKAERLNQLMQEAMPRQQEMEQGYGQVAQGPGGAPKNPTDTMM